MTQQRLSDVLTAAFTEVGLSPEQYAVQEQGDGGLALLPTGGAVDEPRLIVGLLRALQIGLTELNEDLVEGAWIRLRVALHEGVVHDAPHGYVGPAVIEVCRLRDAEPVRDALTGSRAPLVAVVADGLYRDVLAHGYNGLPAAAFRPVDVQVKAFSARAWVYLPGELPPAARSAAGADPGAEARPAADGEDGRSQVQRFLDSKDLW